MTKEGSVKKIDECHLTIALFIQNVPFLVNAAFSHNILVALGVHSSSLARKTVL